MSEANDVPSPALGEGGLPDEVLNVEILSTPILVFMHARRRQGYGGHKHP